MAIFTPTTFYFQPQVAAAAAPVTGSIVTDGLVFYIDSKNTASYPGSGSSIYNLSTINVTGSLFNGVTYSDGFWTFDGVNQWGNFPGTNMDFGTGTYTYMGASRYTSTSGGDRTFSGGESGGVSLVNWLMGGWGAGGTPSSENYYADGTIYGVPGGANDTNWRIYTGTQNTSTDNWKFYVNNSLLANNAGGTTGLKGLNLSRYDGAGGGREFSPCQIAFFLVYNRVLTETEMTQNYNALKGQVGL
jgi:hypothetical protein